MIDQYIHEITLLKQRIIDTDLARARYIVGCSDATIQKIMDIQKITNIPKAFWAYLKIMGTSIGGIYSGAEVGAHAMLTQNLKEQAKSLLEEVGISSGVLDRAIVYFMHQGHTFFFVSIDEGDNPPVYMYSESHCSTPEECKIERVADSFIEHLSNHINEWSKSQGRSYD